MTSTCETCRFWNRDDPEGDCRRYAPRPQNSMEWHGEQWWPLTHPTDWCGEHQPKEA